MTSMIKLNKKQKRFLFENYYVTAKVLDSLETKGWQDFFINHYQWELNGRDQYGFERLYLKDEDGISYTIGLNFQDDDYDKLLSIKSK